MGGAAQVGAIDWSSDEQPEWAVLAAAIRSALTAHGIATLDEIRRATEDLSDYADLGYFERRVNALQRVLAEKGLLTDAEVELVMHRSEDSDVLRLSLRPDAPRFELGAHVVVNERPWEVRHVRTPRYVQGRVGKIVDIHGPTRNPELLAYGEDGFPERWVYSVSFKVADIFGKTADRSSPREDGLVLDLFEHWLQWHNPFGTGD